MKTKTPKTAKLQATYARSLYQAIAHIESNQQAKAFFEDLYTPTEIQTMVDRWCIANLLAKGLSYREIAHQTGASVTTIGRVARYLKYGTGGYQQLLNKFKDAT